MMLARSRCACLAIGTLVFAAFAPPAASQSDPSWFAADRVLLGAGGGAIHLDLPDPNDPGADAGTRPRAAFELGAEIRPWLELGADCSFAALGESDSLNAILAMQGSSDVSSVTHVEGGILARARWVPGGGRWAGFGRAGGGVAGTWTSAPGDLGGHELDPAWNAGAGIEFHAHPRWVLRAEGLYIGQATEDGARHHGAATLSLLLALWRDAGE